MTSFRVKEAVRRAGRNARPARFFVGSGIAVSLAAASLASSPAQAAAATGTSMAFASAPDTDGRSIADFYAESGERPFWFASGNEQAAYHFLGLLENAHLDGLSSRRYPVRELQRALRSAWGGNADAQRRAEMLLSQAFVAYARDLQQAPDIGVIYVDPQLRPRASSPRDLLDEAARAPSLEQHIRTMGWMHPFYGQLRDALAQSDDKRERALLTINLERVRLLPNSGRHVIVNAAGQRLYMFDDGQMQDMMRVVVGKPHQQTPMMAALIRFTSLNPYWNVPPDLTAERIAPYVLKEGPSFLHAKGYQVLSDWTDRAEVVDPSGVDWKAVAEGREEIRVRQLPGPANAMGRMKFMFPNVQGIYLHDTPSTELFSEAARLFSGGCVRLEAAPRLALWLYGKRLKAEGARPEQHVDLPRPVPVYLTYLTAMPSGGGEVAYFEDSYGRDAARLAQLSGSRRSEELIASNQ